MHTPIDIFASQSLSHAAMHRSLFFALWCSAALIFAPACAKHGTASTDEVPLPAQTTETRKSVTITPESGGYLNLGNIQLAIPAGAVESETTVTAEIDNSIIPPTDVAILGYGVKFEPEGLQFLKLPELKICYDSADSHDEGSTLIYYQSQNADLVAISGSVNSMTHCVSGRIEHFSSYVAAARAQVAGNALPAIGGANFLPATPMAGIPLRVRTQINDRNGGGVQGQVVSAFLYYRTSGSTTFNKVPLMPDDTDSSVTNRYFFLIPANEVTLAGIDYYFEATDNLNAKRTTAMVSRSVPTTANALRFNPATNLTISSGFMRALTLQASANGTAGPWQNISIENQSLSNVTLGTLTRTDPSTIRFIASGAGVGTIDSNAGTLSAAVNVAVVPGLLNRIAITDMNQVEMTGTLSVPAGQTLDFDAVGYDYFGNWAIIRPVFTTTGGIGSVSVNVTGAHFTASGTPATGTITALLSTLAASANVVVYVPPAVISTNPADGALNVSLTSPISASFNKAMNATTLVAGTDGSCTGTLQVSADGFNTCVAMASAIPVSSSGNSVATLTPATVLTGRAVYKIRVSTLARDAEGYYLPSQYISTNGFTVEPDLRPPIVIATNPLPGAVSVPHSPIISVTFDHAMNPATISAANFSLLCSGSPIPITLGLQASDTVALITPQIFLPGFASCTLTVTTGAQSNENVSMASPYVLSFVTGAAPVATMVREVDIVQPAHGGMFTAANGKVFFVAQVVSFGKELWSTDGTFSNTQQVRDIYAGFGNSSNPDYLVPAGNKLFFVAEDGVNGRELWISDGSLAGTLMVKDIYAGAGSSSISDLIVHNGVAYFSADDGIHGQELWKSDGTAAGTAMIKDISLNNASSNPTLLTAVNGIIYFSATDSSAGYELWKSDGTNAGTVLVRDINAGSGSSYPKGFASMDGSIFFSANDGLSGEELWKSDGSAVNTTLVLDIAAGTASSFPEKLTNFGGNIYFMADDGSHGKELWRTDGTALGSALVKDMNPGISSSFVTMINVAQNGMYLTNQSGTAYELWFSSGDAVGTSLLASFTQSIGLPALAGGRAYFSGFASPSGSELWSSNGAAAGTVLAQNIKAGSVSSNPTGFYGIGSTLYFRISDPFSSFPTALWKFE